MILIADSGSTKVNWLLASRKDDVREMCTTTGINPYFQDKTNILSVLRGEFLLPVRSPSHLYFYGAGCTQEKTELMREVLASFFNTSHIRVYSDLFGAARSLCQREKGIACILGTGSNSCYYDGSEIRQNIPSLGFILGDEGSGASLGKDLLGNILKKQFPAEIEELFFRTFRTERSDILESVYRNPFPSRYLARFAPFIAGHINYPEILEMVQNNFRNFVRRNLLSYPEAPVHFTGSIAWHFREELKAALDHFSLQLGTITSSPLDGLAKYHESDTDY